MKIIKYLIVLFSFLFLACPTLNKNGMGIQRFDNVNLSMIEIYNVLQLNFPDYNIGLIEIPESSSYMIYPKRNRGTYYVKARHTISIHSEKYSISIQYLIDSINRIDSYATFPGITISYYLRGDNIHERIDELREPMEKIKLCLIENFYEVLSENNISQEFRPIPIR